MPIEPPQSDLSRVIAHEADMEWPTSIEIVAYWKNRTRNKRQVVRISGEDFFGLNSGAPMTGDQLIGIIERLRRQRNG